MGTSALPCKIPPMADLTLSELTERAETAKAITDPTARRVELRAVFGAATNYRLAAIEQHLGIVHEDLDALLQTLQELNASFEGSAEPQ